MNVLDRVSGGDRMAIDTVMVGHREIRDLEGTHRFYRFRTPLRGRHAPFLSGLTVVSRWFHGGFMVVSPGHFGYLLVGRIGRGLVDAAGGSGRGRVSPSRCNAGGGVGRVHSTMYAPMRDEGGLV